MPIPDWVGKMTVLECSPDVKEFKECGVVFSGLDEKVGEIGESLYAIRVWADMQRGGMQDIRAVCTGWREYVRRRVY